MAASSYDAALARVLAHEGGYGNHPSDPGGPTNFGITLADYRRYVKPDATAADIKAMTRDAATTIYRARYWNALACDDLPAGVDYAVFDYGVNSGVARAAKVLRRKLELPDNAAIALVLRAAGAADPAKLIAAICDERMAFLQGVRQGLVPPCRRGARGRVDDGRAAAACAGCLENKSGDGGRCARRERHGRRGRGGAAAAGRSNSRRGVGRGRARSGRLVVLAALAYRAGGLR